MKCKDCGKTFNDKIGTIFYHKKIPKDTIIMIVYLFLTGYPMSNMPPLVQVTEKSIRNLLREVVERFEKYEEYARSLVSRVAVTKIKWQSLSDGTHSPIIRSFVKFVNAQASAQPSLIPILSRISTNVRMPLILTGYFLASPKTQDTATAKEQRCHHPLTAIPAPDLRSPNPCASPHEPIAGGCFRRAPCPRS